LNCTPTPRARARARAPGDAHVTVPGIWSVAQRRVIRGRRPPSSRKTGTPAPDFRLPATGGRTYEFADARTLLGEGFGFAAICSNDAKSYPEDSFANMQRFAKSHRFPFPYLHDEDQAAARAYGAVCTPDFFGYDAGRKLKYRGRLDEGRTNAPPAGARRELVEAMRAIAATGTAPSPQFASNGRRLK
jgi:AhpC/TSA family protein